MNSFKISVRALAALMAALSLALVPAPVLAAEDGEAQGFSDVSEIDPHYDDICAVIDAGLMSGTGADTFSPDMPLCRGMAVTVLYRSAGQPEAAYYSEFEDVDSGSYYASATAWAVGLGLVSGRSEDTFAPNDSISRQELATVLWRYAKLSGMDVGTDGTVLPAFADRESIAPWAGEAVSWACRLGILEVSQMSVLPQGGITRGEFCTMMMRFLKEKNGAANLQVK